MGFDAKKFMKTKFTPRTADVEVLDMRDFFPPGEPCVWKVRGLTGQELGSANESADRNKNLSAIIEALTSSAAKDKAEAVKELLGIGGTTTADISKRLEMIVAGSVSPICKPDLAVRVCEVFPIEFFQITNKILEMTGKGQMPGKQEPSGEKKESAQASRSVMPEGDSSTK